jgi:hypothetical protein
VFLWGRTGAGDSITRAHITFGMPRDKQAAVHLRVEKGMRITNYSPDSLYIRETYQQLLLTARRVSY